MIPVCIYIDGFNLYYAICRLNDDRAKWLNLKSLAQRLIFPRTETLVGVYYFSAFARWLPGPLSRHQPYVAALRATGVTCVLGHFKIKDRECKTCGSKWKAHEEKETDVSIGITMIRDAYKGLYDKAYLLTRDSDLVPAVRMIKQEFPLKHICVVAPPNMGHSNDLTLVCDSKKKISPPQIFSCLFPERVYDASGNLAAVRPVEYA
jgi:hypothetical protein